MDTLRMYLKLLQVSMKSRMQYRADFITGIISVLLLNAANLALISVIIHRFNHLNGWNIWEMIFLYCLWMLSHSIYSLFFWHFNTMEEYVIQGTFDQFLIRPLSPLIQFLGREFHYMGMADILVGVIGITLAHHQLQLNWSWAQWLFLPIAVIAGTMIEMSLAWIIACIAFWTGRSSGSHSILIQFNNLVHEYPIDIFGKWFRIVVTGILPVAFINYYPSLYLLGKTNLLTNEWEWLAYASPLTALLLTGIAAMIWTLAIHHYTSSGS